MKVAYKEVFEKANLIQVVPLKNANEQLSAMVAGKLIFVRNQYTTLVRKFEEEMQEVVKELAPEGHLELQKDVEAMKKTDAALQAYKDWKAEDGTERPAKPSPEELAAANKTREKLEDFEKADKELNEAYFEARKQKMKEKVELDEKKFTQAEFAEIINVIGVDGNMEVLCFEVPTGESGEKEKLPMPKEFFLGEFAGLFVAI